MNTLASLAESNAPVTVTTSVDREHWDPLFGQLAFPHFTQAWCYGEGKRVQGWSVERLVFEFEHEPVALCQVLVKRILGLPVAARINRGPLFLPSTPAPELQLAVMSALRERWRFGRRGVLLIAPALPFDAASDALLGASGYLRRRSGGWGSSLVDLEPSPEAIRASFSSKWRNRMNGAIKAGVGVRVRNDAEVFEWMVERHARNMAEKNFVGPDPDFVRAMIAASPGNFRVVQGLLGDDTVSAVLWTVNGIHAETFLSWTSEVGRRTGAHNLLLWQAILDMKAAGCRALDLGGYTTREKYGAYKREMKGREYRLCGEWLAF